VCQKTIRPFQVANHDGRKVEDSRLFLQRLIGALASLMSRKITVYSLLPSDSICEIEASMGNSSPSARRP